MKKVLLVFLCLFKTFSSPCFSQEVCCKPEVYSECCSDCFGFESLLSVAIGAGFRQDNLQWQALFEDTDTILKEKWKNIEMGVAGVDVQLLACNHYFMEVDFDYGLFCKSGHQNISLFDVEGSTPFDELRASTKGHAYNISGAIGYQFNIDFCNLSFAPLLGYSYHFQKFKNSNYKDERIQTADFLLDDVHNRYKYRWRGPWIGAMADFQVTCNWGIYFSYAYHWVRYRATIDESFFIDETPTHQKANSCHGNEFIAGTTYAFSDNWYLGLRVDYKSFFGNKGTSENETTELAGRLSKIRWNSVTALFELGTVF